MRFFFFCFIIILYLNGCECPPNLSTDKDYIPRESSYLSIINLLDITTPINVYSMNIMVKKLSPLQPINYQEFFKFQSGIVDFKLLEGNTPIFNTVIQTQKGGFYSMLLLKSHKEIESILIEENIDKSKTNLYLRFANLSNVDKLRFVVKSNLPQDLEYNLTNKGFTKAIAFPSIPFTMEVYRLPNDSLISKIENININLGNIAYFIIMGDNSNPKIYQSINKYIVN